MIRTIKPKIRRCRTSCRTLKLFVRASFRSLQFHFVALRVVCFAGSSAPLTELISTRGRRNSRIGEHQLSFREQTAGKRDATKARLSRVPGPLDKTAKGDVDHVRLRNSPLENALVLSAAVERQRHDSRVIVSINDTDNRPR